MSLFADILVLAALVAAAWLGARRGLLKSLAGLLIVLVALWGASWAADHLTEPVAQWIEPRVTQRVERKLEESHAADAGHAEIIGNVSNLRNVKAMPTRAVISMYSHFICSDIAVRN